MKFSRTKTHRGFALITFQDLYDTPCNIQKSSLAFDDAIWIGCEGRVHQRKKWNKEHTSFDWATWNTPENVSLNTRMHLTRKQVFQLLPILLKFILTGRI